MNNPLKQAPKFEISDEQESSDYNEDFEFEQDKDINEVADAILSNIKSPTAKPKPTQPDLKIGQLNFTPTVKTNPVKTEIKKKDTNKEQRFGKASFITQTVDQKQTKRAEPKKMISKSKPRAAVTKPQPKPSVPKHSSKPRRNSKLRTSLASAVDPIALKLLNDDNEKLLKQVQDLTKEIDLRLITAHRRVNHSHLSSKTSLKEERIKTKKEVMEERRRRIKTVKKDIDSMYKILDSTFKIDEVIDKENKLKAQQRILRKQELRLKDCKKVIRGQDRFFKDVERTNDQAGHTEDIETHYTEAKNKLRELKDQFRQQDKELKDQHCIVETMREKNRKIRDIIQEKKRTENESGLKNNPTEDDTAQLNAKIEELELKKEQMVHQYKGKLHTYDERIYELRMHDKRLEKELKNKEDEVRMIKLKIKEFKRIMKAGPGKSTERGRVFKITSNKKPKYMTPAKESSKYTKGPRSNSSRKTIDDTFKFDAEVSDTSYLDTKKIDPVPSNILNQRVVEEVGNEESYGSDFDNFSPDVSANLKRETKNITNQKSPKLNFNSTQETAQASHIAQFSPENPEPVKAVQSKIASKPNFMMKRKF